MRGKGWIRDVISHFAILLILGAGLFLLYKKAGEIPALKELDYLDKAFLAAFLILALMVIIFIFQLFSSVKLERFSPGNPESLKRLERIRRFRLPREYVRIKEVWPSCRTDFRDQYPGEGWKRSTVQPFDAILTRRRRLPTIGSRPPLIDRIFLFYHPMMNVIIVDQILKECERTIEEQYKEYPAPRNLAVFLTDMKNRDEITSAGAGIVNYLCVPGRGTSLYPVLLDMEGGRFFYPLDTSLAARRHRIHYWIRRLRTRSWIIKRIRDRIKPQES